MNKEEKQNKALYNEIVEKTMNNHAAIRVLIEIVVDNELVTLEDFNKMVQETGGTIKREMYDRVKQAGEE